MTHGPDHTLLLPDELLLHTFSWVKEPIPNDKRAEIVRRISEALTKEDTQDAVRRATGDRRRILDRVKAMVLALEAAQIEVDVPINLNVDE